MRIAELDKKYCRQRYKSDYDTMIDTGDYLLWDEDRTKSAFAFGNGTEKDLKRYMKDNRCYARFYDLNTNQYI